MRVETHDGSCARFTPTNYPQLQNLLKKDPLNYYEEFLQQEKYFKSLLSLQCSDQFGFGVDVQMPLISVINFLAHTSGCYEAKGRHLSSFVRQLIDTIQWALNRNDPSTARALLPSLMVVRHKTKDESNVQLIRDFIFEMALGFPDSLTFSLLVQEAKSHSSSGASRTFRKKVTSCLLSNTATKNAIDETDSLLVPLRLAVDMFACDKSWQEPEIARAISECCFSPIAKISLLAINFFLGSTAALNNTTSKDSSTEHRENLESLRHSIHTGGKKRSKLRKEKQALKKLNGSAPKEPSEPLNESKENIIALNLLTNPEGFCERIGTMLLGNGGDKLSYDHRMVLIRLQSTLISFHKLIVPVFYEKIIRYLRPNQRECTRILAYVASAMHPDLAADEEDEGTSLLGTIQMLTTTISRNFVSDHFRPEVITVGLNALREIASRLPQALSKENLQEMVTFASGAKTKAVSKNKGVLMAARSLLSLYRSVAPEMLPQRLRGRPAKPVPTDPLDQENISQDSSSDGDDDEDNGSEIEESGSELDEDNDEYDDGVDESSEEDADASNHSSGSDNGPVSSKKHSLASEMTYRFLSNDELRILRGDTRSADEEDQDELVPLEAIQRGAHPGGKPTKEEKLKLVHAGRTDRKYGKYRHHISQAKKRKCSKSFMMMVHKKGGRLSKAVKALHPPKKRKR